jgi:MOSC domain-containing protein YiiM
MTGVHDSSSATDHHRSMAELESGLRSFPKLPKDMGRLALMVRRAAGGHEVMERAHLTPEKGLPGDRWAQPEKPNPEAQLTVMRRDVAELIANGQALSVFGDNLFVDLDISAENLPIGTRLRVGSAVVEVTPMAHNGCKKFDARFGVDALRFVNAPGTRNQNLRGIYWKVVEAGEAEVGATIKVIARP